ncbi:MAG: lytic transglycosylase, partial [Betaproteobacteria bacterium HGW-Betaproteobacteria-15]
MAPGAAYAPQLQARFAVSTSYKAVRHLIREAATAYGLEYELLKAVIATESGFNAHAVSPKGAVGLMQLM